MSKFFKNILFLLFVIYSLYNISKYRSEVIRLETINKNILDNCTNSTLDNLEKGNYR